MAALLFHLLKFSFTLRRDRAERDAAPFFIHSSYPSGNHVADLHRFVKVFHETVRNLADMNQAAAIGSQFDKHAEWHHADDHTDHLIPRFEAGQRWHG